MKLYEILGIGGNALGFGGGGSGSGVTISSGGTSNVLARFDGAGGIKDSALTDNGTNVVSTEPIQIPASNAVAGLVVTGATTTGIAIDTSPVLWLIQAGSRKGVALSSTGDVKIAGGAVNFQSGTDPGAGAGDLFIRRRAAANTQLGATDVNGVPVAQTISVQNAITGSDLPGSTFTLDAPLGTGLGAGAKTVLNRAIMKATGATAQTAANAFVIGESKTLSNTSATTTALATIGLASNSGGGAAVFVTLVATDGTNFDSETQSFNVSFVNKAGAITISTPTVTASSAVNNSGSATIGATVTAGASLVNINVTPVFTTIVPTTVTAYIEIHNHGTGAVTIL